MFVPFTQPIHCNGTPRGRHLAGSVPCSTLGPQDSLVQAYVLSE